MIISPEFVTQSINATVLSCSSLVSKYFYSSQLAYWRIGSCSRPCNKVLQSSLLIVIWAVNSDGLIRSAVNRSLYLLCRYICVANESMKIKAAIRARTESILKIL